MRSSGTVMSFDELFVGAGLQPGRSRVLENGARRPKAWHLQLSLRQNVGAPTLSADGACA